MRVMKLGGREFPLRDEVPKAGKFIVLAKRAQSGDAGAQMASLYDMISMWIADPTGLDEALGEMDLDEINAAVAEAMKQFSDRPTVRPSSSADGSQPTPTTSKVVSLSRGVVEVERPSLTG